MYSDGTYKSGEFRYRKYKCGTCMKTKHLKIGSASGTDVKSVRHEETKSGLNLDGQISSMTTDRVKILSDFLRQCDVDQSVWEVDRYVLNAWDVTMKIGSGDGAHGEAYTNYQIKVWLKRKAPVMIAMESLIQGLHDKRVELPPVTLRNLSGNNMFEVAMYDHHFGKYAWKMETGENYDLKIAKQLWADAIFQHERQAKIHKPKQIVLPVGNDFMHVNNSESTTAKGTRQDTDGRMAKIFDVALESVILSVELLQKIAPVHIIFVVSNHDENVTYFLCKALWAYYANNQNITFDIAPKSRKFYKWGKNFIGYEHGQIRPDKLPLLFADEFAREWADATWRELHVGHLHKAKQINFTSVDTIGSTIYRILPSLTSTDYWHYKSGFVNKTRCSDSFVWNKEEGLIDNFHINI